MLRLVLRTFIKRGQKAEKTKLEGKKVIEKEAIFTEECNTMDDKEGLYVRMWDIKRMGVCVFVQNSHLAHAPPRPNENNNFQLLFHQPTKQPWSAPERLGFSCQYSWRVPTSIQDFFFKGKKPSSKSVLVIHQHSPFITPEPSVLMSLFVLAESVRSPSVPSIRAQTPNKSVQLGSASPWALQVGTCHWMNSAVDWLKLKE